MNEKINKAYKIIDEIDDVIELKLLLKELIINNENDEFIENYIIYNY